MHDGKRGRSRNGHGARSKVRATRRVPPPDGTGRQARFLRDRKDSAAPMTVKLTNGEIHHGHIEYFDRDMIKLTSPEGPNLFIRTSDIRYLVDPDED